MSLSSKRRQCEAWEADPAQYYEEPGERTVRTACSPGRRNPLDLLVPGYCAPSRPQRWAAAVETLRELQAEYQGWLDNLPAPLQASALAEKLEEVWSVDIDSLDVELPLGFGRD
jgi:hypothetical protein